MDNRYQSPNPQENLLDDLDVNLVQASSGLRLVNLLVDAIAYYAFLFGLAFIARPLASLIVIPFMPALLFGLFSSVVEAVFKGKSLGKLITRTRAVQEDGSPITTAIAFKRGFSRMVPFEAFSALGSPPHPWHDKWSHTYVVNEDESRGLAEKSIV